MAVNPHPTLSTDGWVQSTKNRLDAMFADFLVALYSQYPQAKIETSLSWLLVRYQQDYLGLSEGVRSALAAYLSTKFTGVQVDCIAEESDTRADWIKLRISAVVTDEEGVITQLSEIRSVGGPRTADFAKFNNGTLPYFSEEG